MNSTIPTSLEKFQIVIQGAGPVGLACAGWLLSNNPELRLVILDKNPADDAFLVSSDSRGIAISEGSKQLLLSLGAWPSAAPEIRHVHISQKGHFGRTVMHHDELAQPALGHIVRYKDVYSVLRKQLKERQKNCPNFTWLFKVGNDSLLGTISSQTCLIHADGGLFHEQEAKDRRHDYQQSALVGWLKTSNLEDYTAWERFTSQGPLAILPHHDGNAYKNFVWCASPERIAQLELLPENEFLEELTQAFGLPIGQFLEVHDRRTYPLGLNIRQEIIKEHEVWIGNAAQTLHPVAGQGLNLGLRDAATLANTLGNVFLRSAPDYSTLIQDALKTYASLRKHDRTATIGMTDLMARVFATDLIPIVVARGLALSALQWFPGIKKAIARQMMFGQR